MTAALVELHQVANDLDEVFLREHREIRRRLEIETLVDLVATDATEVVALGREEQALESLLRRQRVRRVTGSEKSVDLLERELFSVLESTAYSRCSPPSFL